MSNKTNNSDISSSNEDGILYKYDDLRSLTSFNSSEMSQDTKNPDSGIGTSTASSYMNHRDKPNCLIIKNVELLNELQSLLKIPMPGSKVHQKNEIKFDTSSESNTYTDKTKGANSEKDSCMMPTPSVTESITTINTNVNKKVDYDADLLVYKAIEYIKKLKKTQVKKASENNNVENHKKNTEPSSPISTESSCNKELIANISYKNEEMCISILVKTGLIVYVDERLTNLLGQNAKGWINRRPIDYLYKDDINLLLTKLCELTNKINTGCKNISEIEIEPFYLRFKKEINKNGTNLNETDVMANRQNSSESTSSSSTSPIPNTSDFMPRLLYNCDSNEYLAFRVELKADKVELKTLELDEKANKTHLIQNPHHQFKQSQHQEQINLETCILFKLSYPTIAYFKDIDNYTERSFISEHDVNLQITRVENKVTELLGYLPQELERKSFIKFIHPDDLAKIKQIHFDIFDGKERQNQEIYRWRCHNGCYVSVRTNWSWFIHPWKKQIDFIIGKHVVLVDPMNKNIFEDNKKYEIPNKNLIQIKSSYSQQTNQKSNSSSSNVNLISNKSTETNSDESNNDKRTFNLSSSKDDGDSDFLNKTEKDIIEYISRKIPGMDDATQMLGQDVIKFIKKKNISASYCQEQSRIMKKKNRNANNYRPLQKYKYAYDYPQYFQTRPHLEKSAVKRLANFQSYHTKHHPANIRSSSSSNSEYARVKAKFALRRNKRLNKAMSSKQANEAEILEQTNPDLSDESKVNILSSQESNHEPKILNKTQTSTAESILSPATKSSKQAENQQNLPSLFEDIFSKKSFQPSLIKDHSFFTQYMICKYIDDLPNSWTIDDGTAAATGDITVGQESYSEIKSENRGTKRTLDDEENQRFTDYPPESSVKTRKLSSTQNIENNIVNVYPKNQATNFLGEKTVLDYLMNNNEHSNNQILLANVNSNEDQTIYKKANSYSSKSHSRIVLIDENDNDDEEETVKMIISQTSEENQVDFNLSAKNENQSVSIQSSNIKPELKVLAEKCARLTKENLAKHTREQDEIYLTEILKKVQKNFPKKISENPQNICALTPNVFSCNEYEPQMKKIKKMHQILTEKNPNSSVSSAELVAQYENELNIGPYSGAINEIDFDNPQNYHESFNKKLQADLTLAKDLKPIEKLAEKSRLDKKHAEETKIDIPSQKATKNSGKDKDSTINSSQPSSSSLKNDDVLSFWKKCIRQGSAIVKRIKESDNLIKIISSANQKKAETEQNLQNQENLQSYTEPNLVNMNILQGDSRENLNDEVVILKFTKQLKKRLYIISSLLGINTDIGFDDISIDSDKSEIIESYIKKIVQELLKTTDSVNLTRYSNRITSKILDTNSMDLLTCLYEDLKNKFLSQFDKFNKDNKLIFNSSSSAAFPSSTSNNDDESSSQNQAQANLNNISRSVKSKSPNDFEFSSHNTNEFDDSSTYLYDSPTSSLESTDMLSLSNNPKKPIVLSRRPKSWKSKLSNEELKIFHKQRSSHHEENGFDDGLLCKIMQNYIELFKKNDETEPVLNLEDSKFCVISNKTSTDESAKMVVESCSRSNDASSEETKSNKTKQETPESKIEEEECIKNLSINIYNDCFKCLSKVSALDNLKNNSNENESD